MQAEQQVRPYCPSLTQHALLLPLSIHPSTPAMPLLPLPQLLGQCGIGEGSVTDEQVHPLQ